MSLTARQQLTLQWIAYLSQDRVFTLSAARFQQRTGISKRSAERDFEVLEQAGWIKRVPPKLKARKCSGTLYKRRKFYLVSHEPTDFLQQQVVGALALLKQPFFKISYLALRLRCTPDQAVQALLLVGKDGRVSFEFDPVKQGHTLIRVESGIEAALPSAVPEPPRHVLTDDERRADYLAWVKTRGGKIPPHDVSATYLDCSRSTVERLVRALKTDGLVGGAKKQNLRLLDAPSTPSASRCRFGVPRYDTDETVVLPDERHDVSDKDDEDSALLRAFVARGPAYAYAGETYVVSNEVEAPDDNHDLDKSDGPDDSEDDGLDCEEEAADEDNKDTDENEDGDGYDDDGGIDEDPDDDEFEYATAGVAELLAQVEAEFEQRQAAARQQRRQAAKAEFARQRLRLKRTLLDGVLVQNIGGEVDRSMTESVDSARQAIFEDLMRLPFTEDDETHRMKLAKMAHMVPDRDIEHVLAASIAIGLRDGAAVSMTADVVLEQKLSPALIEDIRRYRDVDLDAAEQGDYRRPYMPSPFLEGWPFARSLPSTTG